MPLKKAEKVLNLDFKNILKKDLVDEAIKLGVSKTEANKLRKDQLVVKIKKLRNKEDVPIKKTRGKTITPTKKKTTKKKEDTVEEKEDSSDISLSDEEENVELADFNKAAKEDLEYTLKWRQDHKEAVYDLINSDYFLEVNKSNYDNFVKIFDMPDNYAGNYTFKRLLETLYLNYPQLTTLKIKEIIDYMKEAINIYLRGECVETIEGKLYVSSDARWILEKGWGSIPLHDTRPREIIINLCVNQVRLRHHRLDTRSKWEVKQDEQKERNKNKK